MASNLKHLKVMPRNVSSSPTKDYIVSEEQFKFYHEQGYLVIKGLIEFDVLYAVKQRFRQICTGLADRGMINVVKEPSLAAKGLKGEDLVNKLQEILYDEVFAQYTEHPVMLRVLSQFVGPNITGMHSMMINKPPGTSRHPPHQDLYYFPFRPVEKIIAAWTAVDDVTLDNGCLYVIPRSHRNNKLYIHGNRPDSNFLYHGILEEAEVAPEGSRVYLEMSPGDTVFFHPLLVHGSGPNVTKNYRKAISCHYASSSCEYIDVSRPEHSQYAALGAELEREMQRRGIQGLRYVDMWRAKNKQVLGVKCNL